MLESASDINGAHKVHACELVLVMSILDLRVSNFVGGAVELPQIHDVLETTCDTLFEVHSQVLLHLAL